MRRRMAAAIAMALICTMGIPVSAADFSDGAVLEAPEEIFDAGTEDGIEDEAVAVFSDAEATPASENHETPESVVVLDGITYEYQPESDTYKLTKGVNISKVEIPRDIRGKIVSEIVPRAFYGFEKVTDVQMYTYPAKPTPQQVIIGESAFEGCRNLRGISLPVNVDVRSRALWGCPKLVKITVSDGKCTFAPDVLTPGSKAVCILSDYVASPETETFIKENDLLAYDAESGVDYMGYDDGGSIHKRNDGWEIYDYANSFKEVYVGTYIVGIRRLAYYDCDQVESVVLPEGVKDIQTKAFAECDNLREIQIPQSVQSISEDAFEGTPDVVIYAPEDSYAHHYAKEQGISYKNSEGLTGNAMPAPTITKAVRQYGHTYDVFWEMIPQADEYQIWSCYDPDSNKYEMSHRIKVNFYGSYDESENDVELKGNTQKIKIRAICRRGIYETQKSPFSEPITLKVETDIPRIRSASNKNTGKIALKWTQPEGSEGYILYRSETGKKNDYTKRKTIYKGSWDGYTDNDVKKGKTYYYKVKTFRIDHEGKRLYSEASDAVKIKCKK